jgi:hypothetical protein
MGVLRGIVLIAATMTLGLVADVFCRYANAIMPGLRRTDNRTFTRVVITLAVNVPSNDGIKAAGNPDRISDLTAVRRRFKDQAALTPGKAAVGLHKVITGPARRLHGRRLAWFTLASAPGGRRFAA